jgi:hypothetical protein
VPCGERAALAVADVLRDHVAGLRLCPEQAKAVAHILACRTGRLGGHLAFCDRCGYKHFAYHSCRDRHCPRCGSLDQALWAEAQIQHLLPISYFHLGFTLPASLRPFFRGPDRANAFEALFLRAAPPSRPGRRPSGASACSAAPSFARPRQPCSSLVLRLQALVVPALGFVDKSLVVPMDAGRRVGILSIHDPDDYLITDLQITWDIPLEVSIVRKTADLQLKLATATN